MRTYKNIDKIIEFTNDGITYGAYSLLFNDRKVVFIRNGDSVATVSFNLGQPANKCVDIIRDDVRDEFLALL